jgi:hypothetical protein
MLCARRKDSSEKELWVEIIHYSKELPGWIAVVKSKNVGSIVANETVI